MQPLVLLYLTLAGAETLDVTYVAEYHENLQHVVAFLTVSGLQAGVELEAEVVPPESGSNDDRAQLLLRCGASTSQRLALPAPVAVGPAQVSVVGGRHFQVKLAATPPASPQSPETEAELDATHLQHIQPTTLICASCSLPLVRASMLHKYRDLPSEHWAELVDAWMCHADQKLHEHVQKGSKEGFWPVDGEALVGGSYVLLRESAVVKVNLHDVEDPDANKVSVIFLPDVLLSLSSGDQEGRHWDSYPWPLASRRPSFSGAPSKPSSVLDSRQVRQAVDDAVAGSSILWLIQSVQEKRSSPAKQLSLAKAHASGATCAGTIFFLFVLLSTIYLLMMLTIFWFRSTSGLVSVVSAAQ